MTTQETAIILGLTHVPIVVCRSQPLLPLSTSPLAMSKNYARPGKKYPRNQCSSVAQRFKEEDQVVAPVYPHATV